jgi:hypothetical protein
MHHLILLRNYGKQHMSMTSNSIFYQAGLLFYLTFQCRYILFFTNTRDVLCSFQLCRCVIDNIEDLLSLAATIHELLDHRVISRCASS